MDQAVTAVATAVAGKVAGDLTEAAKGFLVKLRRALRERFTDQPEALAAREAARDGDGEDLATVHALARHLVAAREADPKIGELTDRLRPHLIGGDGDVANSVNGDLRGSTTVIQGLDMNFGSGGLHIER